MKLFNIVLLFIAGLAAAAPVEHGVDDVDCHEDYAGEALEGVTAEAY